uniref:Uncharacterized protein n=1 Tax=Helianthus annuus TaxID=4232 RepID=A0A251T857_HELAN
MLTYIRNIILLTFIKFVWMVPIRKATSRLLEQRLRSNVRKDHSRKSENNRSDLFSFYLIFLIKIQAKPTHSDVITS